MAENKGLEFVGIVEHVDDNPSYDYCRLNTQSSGMIGYENVQNLGESIAHEFREGFRQKITYEPPQGILKKGLRLNKYHKLSVLEQDNFEKSVLETLQGKE